MEHPDATDDPCSDRYLTERYVLGELPEQEMLDFEEHFFDCPQCADDVKATTAFVESCRQVFFEKADREGASGEAESTAAGPAPPASSAWWLGLDRLRRPVFWQAAALILLLPAMLYQSLVVVPELRQQIAAEAGPKAVSWSFLSVSRGSVPVIELTRDQHFIGLRLSKSSGASFSHYRCEVRDAEDRVVQWSVIPSAPTGQEVSLVVPAAELSAGAYAIVLSGLDSAANPVEEVSRYRFDLKILD